MLGKERALEIIEKALSYSRADQTQVVVGMNDTNLTRYARSVIHQNVAERNAEIEVKAIIGKKIGYASANILNEAGIRATVDKAILFARHQVENPDFKALPGPKPEQQVDTFIERTAEYTPEKRAEGVAKIVGIAGAQGVEASGAFMTGESEIAVGNSLGVRVYNRSTSTTVTSVTSADGGFGYSDRVGRDAGAMDFQAVGQEATERAVKSKSPTAIEPGEYEVVLMNYAVEDMLSFLAYLGFGALAVQEGRSFMNDKFGTKICDEKVSIWDDGLDARGMMRPFDPEGVPKQRVDLIKNGIANAVVYDSYTAHREGKESTGHSSGGVGTFGPYPTNIVMAPGDTPVSEMIANTGRGILVTRFHYTNVVHPTLTIITGMTRDGTFLIEDGKITRPLKNLRFTQSVIEALSNVESLSPDLKCQGYITAPAAKVTKFNFTGVTEF